MMSPSQFDSRLVALVLAVAIAVAAIEGAAALAIATVTYDSLRLSDAATPGLDGVLVERWSLNQSGGDIVAVTTAINNTNDTLSLSVDVIVRLEKLDGSVVEKETETVLLQTVGVKLVSLTLAQPQPPDAFAGVNVTVTPSV